MLSLTIFAAAASAATQSAPVTEPPAARRPDRQEARRIPGSPKQGAAR